MDQQQILAEQLRKYQAQAQTQAPQGRQVGGVYVAPNPLEYLAAGLRGYGGMKGEQQTQQAMTDLQAKRQAARAEVLRGFTDAARGTPYNPGTQGLEEFGRASIPETQAQPGDMSKAFGILQNSEFPEYQQAGMQGIVSTAAEQQKRAQLLADKERERLENEQKQQRMLGILQQTQGNPQAAIAAGVPPEVVKSFYESPNFGKPEGTVINGQLVNKFDGTPIGQAVPKQAEPFTLSPGATRFGPDNKPVASVADPNKPFNPDGTPNLSFQGYEVGKARAGAARNSQTVINAGPKEFEKELGQLDAKQLGKYRDNAETAQSLLGTVANLREAEKMGAYSGGGADTRLAVSSMIEGWTGIAPKGLVGSQIYNAEANKLILDRVKALGANPSNADREFIQKTVPQLATSAEARKQMADWMERTAMKSIDLYQQADAYARKNSGLGGFNVITPATPKPAGLPDASAIDAEIARRKAAKK